jgi:hypothetical protein
LIRIGCRGPLYLYRGGGLALLKIKTPKSNS